MALQPRMTKQAPSYYEHTSGEAERYVPAAARDVLDFQDVTIEVKEISLDDLTPEQREAYDRAFK